ncbi:hypothetical protein ACE5IX_15150 [Leptospira wolffii]|uniref:Uncharacterized protein n=2 Tax=Leptospira wolffii TaxID=409998 RepID=A0ABV5BRS0_9LEPT
MVPEGYQAEESIERRPEKFESFVNKNDGDLIHARLNYGNTLFPGSSPFHSTMTLSGKRVDLADKGRNDENVRSKDLQPNSEWDYNDKKIEYVQSIKIVKKK